jgi:hypothetical protein
MIALRRLLTSSLACGLEFSPLCGLFQSALSSCVSQSMMKKDDEER